MGGVEALKGRRVKMYVFLSASVMRLLSPIASISKNKIVCDHTDQTKENKIKAS